MKYAQGDIVSANFLFPNGTFKEHLATIVSSNELQEDERTILKNMFMSWRMK
jgi:hypothetical protein